MNNYNSNSNGNSSKSAGLRAEPLYTASPDALQRMHPHLQLRSGKAYADPVAYDHPWSSMRDFARLLSLRYEALRTRHTYYRDLRLLHEYFNCDPALLTEALVTDYL